MNYNNDENSVIVINDKGKIGDEDHRNHECLSETLI